MAKFLANRRWSASAVLVTGVVVAFALKISLQHAEGADTSVALAPDPPSTDIVTLGTTVNPAFIQAEAPQQKLVEQTLNVSGKLSLDRQLLRIAAARVAGRLGRIFVTEGQSVSAGAPLAELYSPEYLSAEKEFLIAESFSKTLAKDADAELRLDADATARAAAGKLKALGAADADIARLRSSGTVEEYLQVRAPISGVVIQRNVDAGAYLNIGDTLMTLAQLDPLWLQLNVYETDYALLMPGLALTFETPALPGERLAGRISFIAPAFDAVTHTLPVRCDVPNPRGRLRPEMPVNGLLTVASRLAWVIPRAAVLQSGDADYVFVQESAKRYRRVLVHGFVSGPTEFAVTDGLNTGAPVVADGAVLLNQALGG